MMPAPLTGLRVLAFESWGAGAFGGMMLAQLGADVIAIENPATGGNPTRAMGPYYFDTDKKDSEGFEASALNKRCMTINLKTPQGQDILHDLVRTADATFDNLRGDVPDNLGITYEALERFNPRIVCAHCSGYGRTGPRRTWPGYDFLMQAECGWMSVTGEPGGMPSRVGVSVVDVMGGVYGALALLAAVVSARMMGRGREIDTNLFDIALNSLCYQGIWYLDEGVVKKTQPRSAHASQVPCQLYRTSDGWMYIACLIPKYWEKLCELIGRQEFLTDPRFVNNESRLRHRDQLTQILDGIFKKKTKSEWMDEFAGKVPCAPVFDIGHALDNPYVRDNRKILEIPHPERGVVRVIGSPFQFDGEQIHPRLGEKLGASTDAILKELGYDETRIANLRKAGAI